MRFNTASLPDNAQISSATLTITAAGKVSSDGRSLIGSWIDGSANWPISGSDWVADAGTTALAGTALSSITVGSQTDDQPLRCRADQPDRLHGIAVGAIGSGSHRGQLPADHCRRFEPGRRPHRHLHDGCRDLAAAEHGRARGDRDASGGRAAYRVDGDMVEQPDRLCL